ncbi:MAG: T9SS type A sorting domain-containing protein [Bacteroidetes bacterium]|nr:T9SS type A sorting domain-containing protein [Bacteroidota bacterium]
MSVLLLLFVLATGIVTTSSAQTMMPLPPHSSTYTASMVRGYWFQAPTDFRILGVRVPTDASTAPQNIQIFLMGGNPSTICTYPTLTTNYTTLGVWYNVNTTTMIPCDILVHSGDYIGIVGARGTNGGTMYNSYDGASPYNTTIFGLPVALTRFGHQGSTFPITTGVWTENSTVCRVEIYYGAALNPIPNDAGISSIDAPFGFCAGTEDVVVSLHNYGTLQLTSAVINWTINGLPQSSYTWTGLLDTLTPASRETQVNLGPKTWAANTPYTVRAWTTLPNNIVDTLNSNDTTEVLIQAGLAGSYTIGGASPDYATFEDAVDALETYGVCGAVTFTVASGTYFEELDISPIPGASATSTITFDGGSGNAATRILTTSQSGIGATLMLDGADYLRFRNLTITSTGLSYGTAVWFTGGADHNVIENCILESSTSAASSNMTTVVGSASKTSISTSGTTGSFNRLENNSIRGGYYGIYWRGSGTTDTTQNKSNQYIGNEVTDWYYYGMYSYYSNALVLDQNRFERRSSATTSAYGLYIYYANLGPQITGNLVIGNAYGLRLYYANNAHSSYALTEPRAKIYNNMFIAADQSTSSRYGTYVYRPQYTDFWHNNIIVNSTGSSYVAGYFYTYSGYQSVDIRNNMFVSSSPSTASYLLYINEPSVVTGLDHNLYYAPAGPGAGNYFYLGGSTYSWNTLPKTTWNANSVWGEPYFIQDLSDLHARSPQAYLAGIGIPEVSTDYDGETRNSSTPCIGADEFPQPPQEYDMAVLKARVSYATNKWTRLEGSAVHTVKVLLQNIGLVDDPATIDVGISDAPMNTIGDALIVETFSPTWDAAHKAVVEFSTPITGLTASPSATLYARAFLPNEQTPANDQSADTHPIHTDKVYGYEDFFNFEDGSRFTYANGYIDVPGWTVVDINSGDSPVFSGEKYMMTGTSNPANEWLITPSAPVAEAASYRVSFTFENYTNVPVTIEVAYGTSPVPGAMTTFATFSSIGMGTYTSRQLWQATGRAGDPYFNLKAGEGGTYYIGIHVMTTTTGYQWALDNITFDDNPSPPPKIAYGLPGNDITTFIDKPTPPIEIMATYKQPGLINRIYQVASGTDIYGPYGDFLWSVETKTPWLKVTMEAPDPTLQGYNFTPPRPRQFQTFTLTVNTSGLSPGMHYGEITFYGMLFNDDFPPPNKGLRALNEPLRVPVELRIIDTGSKVTGQKLTATICPLIPAGNPYHFVDPQTGDPIASVEVASGRIDCMTIHCYPNQLPINIARKSYVQRYWQIEYTGTGWLANISFPYADSEAGMVFDRSQLRGVRQPSPLSGWEDPIAHTTSVSDVLNTTVTVHDLNEFNIRGNIALAHPYFLDLKDSRGLPTSLGLAQNFPNPFNPATQITYTVPDERHVRVAVYNQLGMEVAVLADGMHVAGTHVVNFDATNLASGTYLCRMTAGAFVQTRTMTLTR